MTREEKRVYMREWRIRNREHIKAYVDGYKPKRAKADRRRRRNNAKHIAAIQRRYRQRHPGRARASQAAWRQANRERYLASQKAYFAKHPGYQTEWKRRTKLRAALFTFAKVCAVNRGSV